MSAVWRMSCAGRLCMVRGRVARVDRVVCSRVDVWWMIVCTYDCGGAFGYAMNNGTSGGIY
jgi:hypothetical protein